MKKKRLIFTIVTCSLAALILLGVMAVGRQSDNFGIDALKRGEDGQIEGTYQYKYYRNAEEDEVTGLSVSWVNGPVELRVVSGRKISIYESSDRVLAEEEKLQHTVERGVLKIKWEDSLLNFSLFENEYKGLVVEIPKYVAQNMTELSCSTATGDITASGFTAKKMKIASTSGSLTLSGLKGGSGEFSTVSGGIVLEDVGFEGALSARSVSGKVELTGAKTEELSLKTVSGPVLYEGGASAVTAESVSGAVSCALAKCPASAKLDSVSGSLVLAIPENDGFLADYSSISGSFSSDFAVTGGAGKSGKARYASGKADFAFATTSGKMEIRKK